jgi:uncharacterized membrane protein (UPF0182 family)
VKAWGYWLGRFDLLTSRRGVVEGASYTEVHAQLPALNFLAIVAIICAILFFLNIRLKQWSLPVVAVGLLAIVSVLLGTAYPAFIQQFKVKPNEQQLEQPYIEDNINATRQAFGLSAIDQQIRTDTAQALTTQEIRQNRTTVSISGCGARARCRRTSRPSSACASTTTSSMSTWTAIRSGPTASRGCS